LTDNPFGVDKVYLTTRAVLIFLQSLFSVWSRFEYHTDSQATKIFITAGLPYNPEAESKLPAIVVQNTGIQALGVAPNPNEQSSIFETRAPRLHADIVAGTVIIHCIAENDVEAGIIGWAVFNAVASMREDIQVLGGAEWFDHRIHLTSPYDASKLVRGASENQWMATSLTVSYRMSVRNLIQESPFVQNVKQKMLLSMTGGGNT
jgi:hypothetical protein